MRGSRTVTITTADGVDLDGDLVVPDDACAGAVICHPHPAWGGDRSNPVVTAFADALAELGIATLRFDFRRELRDPDHDLADGLRAAAIDVQAAIAALRREPALACTLTLLVGYSYGALAALSAIDATSPDDLSAVVLVAPPLTMRPQPPAAAIPMLCLVPEHDQFCATEAAAEVVTEWPNEVVADGSELMPVAMADHFLAGRTAAVVDEAVAWLSRRGLLPSPT